MSPEDFTGKSKTSHPEAQNPSELQTANQDILTELLSLVAERTADGIWRADAWGFGGDGVEQSLEITTGERGIIQLNDYRGGSLDWSRNHLAKITVTRWVNIPGGKGFYTEYNLSRSPDGLRIDKTQGASLPDESLIGMSKREVEALIAEIKDRVDKENIGKHEENELGLTLVSQQEAEDLLAEIAKASPIPTVDRVKK